MIVKEKRARKDKGEKRLQEKKARGGCRRAARGKGRCWRK